MAKSASIGEMNARIAVKRVTRSRDTDGFNVQTESDVFGEPIYVKWVWQHGREAFQNHRMDMSQTATITMRYSNRIDPRCRIYLLSEGAGADPWEIVSIDNVEERRMWMEINLKRRVKA